MHHHNDKEIVPIDLNTLNSVDDLISQWKKAGVFTAGKLGKAIEIVQKAKREDAGFMVGIAGAMVPAGMRKVIVQAIRNGSIHALTTTGANITHDLIETFGGGHIKNVSYEDDFELQQRGIDRVYDAFVTSNSFGNFEDNIKSLLNTLMKEFETEEKVVLSPSELLQWIGGKIEDEASIVRAAHDMDIPIFVPAISDSVLGMQIWMFSQFNNLVIDATLDVGKIQDVYHDFDTNCALIFGGGVPKNFTLQAALIASHHYKYAVQITMDRVETGGLSGATLDEAISWGKLERDSERITVTTDNTIAMPLIFKSLE